MSRRLPNPIRGSLLAVGLALARVGAIDRERVVRTTDLAWPRVITGIARISKSTVDVAMVGIALGPVAIAGLGFATPFWSLAFVFGGGVAGGTISLVSQRFGAGRLTELSRSVVVSALVAVAITLPLTLLFWLIPERLLSLVGTGETAIEYGATYLRVVALAMPFAALNLVGSRTLVGADDAFTPMVLRAGGAVANIALNAVLIFVFDLGVLGAALGTVAGDLLVTIAFVRGFLGGRFPLVGAFPVTIDVSAGLFDRDIARQLGEISTPLVLANLAWTGGQFPLLAIVGLFGPNVVAAFVIALRIRDLLDTPGWGFGLASSSLVGQALGTGEEREAQSLADDVLRFAVAVYVLAAAVVFVFAAPVGRLFVENPAVLSLVEPLIRAACISATFWGVVSGATGPLRASGDTRWPFYGQALGLFVFAVPLAYLGTVTALGVAALHLALVSEAAIPAVVTYYRYRSGRWTAISREYRPAAAGDD